MFFAIFADVKRYFLPFLYIVVLLLTSCHDKIEVQDRRTVIVYMMGENSLARYAQSDISEMISASSRIPKDCNLVIYLDDTAEPAIYTIDAKKGKRMWKQLPEHDSCDSTTFQKNIQEILRNFPAEHYGLVLWSHGSGWLPRSHKTIGVDNNQNTTANRGSELEIPPLSRALEHCGVHWDYILMDACFMQSAEVVYELRNLTDWTIGSPAEIPAAGAPYDLIMDGLMQADPKAIVENYYANYQYYVGVAISAVQCRCMQELADATSQLIRPVFANRWEADTKDIQHHCIYHTWNSHGQDIWTPEYLDAGSAMAQLVSQEDYDQWCQVANKTVPYRMTTDIWTTDYPGFDAYMADREHWLGLSMFIPAGKYDADGLTFNADFRQTRWYQAAGWDTTGW